VAAWLADAVAEDDAEVAGVGADDPVVGAATLADVAAAVAAADDAEVVGPLAPPQAARSAALVRPATDASPLNTRRRRESRKRTATIPFLGPCSAHVA